jgi:hypothetical protein
MLFMLGLGTLSALADGNVVSSWSIEQSKKDGWFLAELLVETPKVNFQGKTMEIEEAWIEKAHRVDYVMGIFPKRVQLPWFWVCMSIKDPEGMFLYSGRDSQGLFTYSPAMMVTTESNYGAPTYGNPRAGGVSAWFRGHPAGPTRFFWTDEKYYPRYVFSLISQWGDELHPDIVLRIK